MFGDVDEVRSKGRPVGEFMDLSARRYWGMNWGDQIFQMAVALDLEGPTGRIEWMAQDTFNRNLHEGVRPYLWWSESEERFALRFRPVSLIGAMWAQAAVSLAGDRTYAQCPICSKPIEISRSGGARTDAIFCSDACKSRNRRQRIAQAHALHAEGVKASTIAKKLKTTPAVIERWLKD